jgi:sugar (pentulose or hexulose) kinase
MFEGLNYQFLEIVRSFEDSMGIWCDRIVAIGGPTKNKLWMQIKADVAGVVVEVPEIEESVPLGAAILAGLGTGIYTSEKEAFDQVYRPGVAYEPNLANVVAYRELYDRYRTLYPALKYLAPKVAAN